MENKHIPIAVVALAILVLIAGGYLFMLKKEPVSPALPSVPAPAPRGNAQFVEEIKEKSIKTHTVELYGCKPVPESVEIKLGESIEFISRTATSTYLFFNPQHIYKIAPYETKSIAFDFWDKPGVRSYTCNNMRAGTVLLTK